MSPNNYSVLLNPTQRGATKKPKNVDLEKDYLTIQSVSNPHCCRITNQKILKEALGVRLDDVNKTETQNIINSTF